MLLLLHVTRYGHETCAHASSMTPLQKLLHQKIIRGHLGSQGSKVHFLLKITKNAAPPSRNKVWTMKLMHMHQHVTLSLSYGTKVNRGSREVTVFKSWFSVIWPQLFYSVSFSAEINFHSGVYHHIYCVKKSAQYAKYKWPKSRF